MLALVTVALATAASVPPVAAAAPPREAEAVLRTAAGAEVGRARFRDIEGRTWVQIEASGLSPGFHGLHIHGVGTCDGATTTPFSSAGGHWNPGGSGHGAHAGDLPPLFAGADGTATSTFPSDNLELAAILDADGAAVIVHAGPDNLANIPLRYRYGAYTEVEAGPDATTLATGDSGGRFACGVVAPAHVRFRRVAPTADATAQLYDVAGQRIGAVLLDAVSGQMRVRVVARGLAPGFHGFHVHALGVCDPAATPPFGSAGGHLNPVGTGHGQHAGDMPALLADAAGTARADFLTTAFTLDQVLDADGAAIVAHAGADNLANIPTRYRHGTFTEAEVGPDATTLATGDAGARHACGVVAPFASPFTDAGTSAGEWITSAYLLGLTAGLDATHYGPTQPVTRGEAAVMLAHLYEELTGGIAPAGAHPFVDLGGSFAEQSVAALYGLGITAGVDTTHYGPGRPVTRAEAAILLDRLHATVAGQPATVTPAPFTDVAGTVAAAAVDRMYAMGVTAGVDATHFAPNAPVTREQVAILFCRLFEGA